MDKNLEPWLLHLERLKENQLSEVWIVYAREGIGKTSTVLGMVDTIEDRLGWKCTTRISDTDADVLYLDDLRNFSKREWQGKKGQLLHKFMRVLRTLFTLTIFTAPDSEDLDIVIRESQIAELVEVFFTGFAVWDEVIQVTPRWQDESWRREIALQLDRELTSN